VPDIVYNAWAGSEPSLMAFIDLANQIHLAKKFLHVKWIFPNAPINRDAMAQAWYYPRPFSPIPVPRHEKDPSPEEEEEKDDETGMMASVDYICGLIDKEVADGMVPLDRIVLGGFSQGCAISLLVALRSRYAGKLRGIIGLSGYLPLAQTVGRVLDAQKDLQEQPTQYLLLHGTRDQMVPRRIFSSYTSKMEEWFGVNVVSKLYEGLGHTTSGIEVRELCEWLEKLL